jgi:hypothetical protein
MKTTQLSQVSGSVNQNQEIEIVVSTQLDNVSELFDNIEDLQFKSISFRKDNVKIRF